MAEWVWEARTRTGELRNGVMTARNKQAVQGKLRAQQLSPLKVERKARELNFQFGKPVSDKELVVFVRQFATMIDAGLPLVQCLDILSSQDDNPRFAAVLRSVKDKVEQGATFSDALTKHPEVFDTTFCNLVSAGEMGGVLDTILNRLAGYIEKRVKLATQVKGALTYPLIVLFVSFGVIGLLLGFVIPTFQEMFEDMGAESLPPITELVIAISDGFLGALPVMIGGVVLAVFVGRLIMKNPRSRLVVHTGMLGLPVLGSVIRKVAVAQFTRTMGTLLSSGVPLLDAMQVVARGAGNLAIENGIRFTEQRIREGSTLAEPLNSTRLFPPMVVQMIGVGEQTGALDQMLSKIADFYEDEVDVAVAAMTSLIEPLIMVVVGGIVGFLLIAMYMPIFSIAGQI